MQTEIQTVGTNSLVRRFAPRPGMGRVRTPTMIPIPYALDAVNFLAADARNLFGPFVNVFLVTSRHWSQTDVGLVTTASGLLGIAFQTPIGAAIDVMRAKRGLIVVTMAAMTAAGFTRRQHRDRAFGRRGRVRLFAARGFSDGSGVRRLDVGGGARHSGGGNQQ
jgi:hypothetical protein